MGDEPPRSCTRCGTTQNPDAPPAESLSWSSERTPRGLRWLCPTCARTHVRDIEGKLPDEYW
nr:hypothetical protein [Crossiella equi]